MIGFLLSPLGKIAGAALLLVALYGGFRLWLHNHDTSLLAGYVLQSELTAADAKAAELERQRNAASQAVEEHRKRLEASQAAEQAAKDNLENEIRSFELQLSEQNRACVLDRAQRDFLLRH